MLGFKRKKKKLEPRKYLTHWELQTRDLVADIAAQLLVSDGGVGVIREVVKSAVAIVEEADRQLLEDVNRQEGRL